MIIAVEFPLKYFSAGELADYLKEFYRFDRIICQPGALDLAMSLSGELKVPLEIDETVQDSPERVVLLILGGKGESLLPPNLPIAVWFANCWSPLWQDGEFKINERPSVRAILKNNKGQIFLFRLHQAPFHVPTISAGLIPDFWITPGGGIDAGEGGQRALERELWEELGLTPTSYQIQGRLFNAQRSAVWRGMPQRLLEEYHQVSLLFDDLSFANQTVEETQLFAGHRWWNLDDLHKTLDIIFPTELRTLNLT